MSYLVEYFEALERLKKGTPKIVDKNTKISNDAVALEAGRKKGSIKKSRPIFSKLIESISEASANQNYTAESEAEKILKLKQKVEHFRLLYEASLTREIMLVKRLYDLESELVKHTKHKVKNIEL